MFALTLLLCVPGIKIAIFSTGRRASGGLLGIIMDFMKRIPGASQRVIRQNQEELFVSCVGSDDDEESEQISKLFSYPSSVKGTTPSPPSPPPTTTQPLTQHPRTNQVR